MSAVTYFAGKSIFITGATGFLGKALVEKLLRSCPDIKQIFILMRSKKGKNIMERLEAFINSPVFNNIRNESPQTLDKIHVVAGDVLLDDLGISNDDKTRLQEECQIIFHSAACVSFDSPLRDAVTSNVLATKHMLDLADEMKHLEAFVHVSTTYCNSELDVLEEKVYRSKHRPQDIISCVDWMDDELLEHMQPKLIKPAANTYVYTKGLAEDLVFQYAGRFPIAIARPSIVGAAYKEPIPGWVDNLNGPSGLIAGIGKGVIRTVFCDSSLNVAGIPVDLAVNGCIILGYTTGTQKPKEIKVCNLTEPGTNPITWHELTEKGCEALKECPYMPCLWYPGATLTNSVVYYKMLVFFTQLLPAYFIDLILFLMGRKPFMVKVQENISRGIKVTLYYGLKQWNFRTDNFLALKNKLSPEEQDIFYTDSELVDFDIYIPACIRGTREYCLKEDPATIPQAKILHKCLYYLNLAVKTIVYSSCIYFLSSYIPIPL